MDTNSHATELDIMQITDSMFPTGLFATSNGLEKLFLDGIITTSADLIEFNKTCIKQQIGPCECVILANAYRAAKTSDYCTIKNLDAITGALKSIRETREASFRAGRQMARCVGSFAGGDGDRNYNASNNNNNYIKNHNKNYVNNNNKNNNILNWWNTQIQDKKVAGFYPVSLGICCNALKIDLEHAVLGLLYGFVAGNVSAALRLGMIQHIEGQHVIHILKPTITNIAKTYVDEPISEAWQFAPHAEINQMQHEKIEAKMFIT